MKSFDIIFPVYNEEKRLENGIRKTKQYIDDHNIGNCSMIIVDNASKDATEAIAKGLAEELPDVSYVRIEEKGVGAAFRAGIKSGRGDVAGYMDIDLSTGLEYLGQTVSMFNSNDDLDVVNATRFSRKSETKGRKWYRNITSYGLLFLLKTVLGMKSSDALCGFVFYRRDRLEKIVEQSDNTNNGWFYTVELLIRAEREGLNIVNLPVVWQDDPKNTTVDVLDTIKDYLTEITKLKKTLSGEKDD